MKKSINKSRLNSLKAAFTGLMVTVRDEINFQIEIVLAAVAIVLAFLLDFSVVEWPVLILAIGMVMSIELINTGFERLADIKVAGFDPMVKIAKDVSAAAVFWASLTALIIGIILFGPRLWQLFAII